MDHFSRVQEEFKRQAATLSAAPVFSDSGVLKQIYRAVKPTKRMNLLDLGCGRGELVRRSAEAGALVWGIDLSREALSISGETLDEMAGEDRQRAGLASAGAGRLPFCRGAFDRVLLSDIMEHLAPVELEGMLREVHRVLGPDGRVVFHTFPNRWFYDIYYPLKRLLWDGTHGRAGPRDPRTSYEKLMHVNELSPRALTRALRPRFAAEIWCVHRNHWDPAAGRFRKGRSPLDWFAQPEIWGVAVKRAP